MLENSKQISVRVTVPAKIMIAGEYAVMEGFSSLSMALDKTLTVVVTESTKESCQVSSSLWQKPFIFNDIYQLKDQYSVLLSTLYYALKDKEFNHFDFKISSNFCVSSGFGSSSALRLAVLFAFDLYLKATKNLSPSLSGEDSWRLAEKAFMLQKEYQTKASGYDILTQKVGGLVSYKPQESCWPKGWSRINLDKRSLKKYLHIFIGGKGAPTKNLLNKTDKWLEEKDLKREFFKLSEELCLSFGNFFSQDSDSSYKELIETVSQHRKFMAKSPYSLSSLEESIKNIPGFDTKWTYKTSGAGGEDALLFFGLDEDLGEVTKCLQFSGWCEESWDITEKGLEYFVSKGSESYDC